jgi:hypothetical protein
MIENHPGAGQLRHHPLQLAAAGDRDIRAARRRPRDIAGELDHVAVTLVGDQERSAAMAERGAVPLRPVIRRQQRGDAGELRAPLVFLPAAGKIAAQQRGFGNAEMPAGKIRVDLQGPLGAMDRLVKRQAVVMHDAEIVMTMRAHGIERRRALANDEGVVEPALHAVNLA